MSKESVKNAKSTTMTMTPPETPSTQVSIQTPDQTSTQVPDPQASHQSVATREAPWMKISKLTDEPLTAAEAAAQGGLDFTVSFYPVTYETTGGERRSMTNRLVVDRDDTHVPLGVVSTTYQPLQYADAFSFMDAVSPHYVAAGCFGGGRQGFMVVRLTAVNLTDLHEVDDHDLYAVLRTSHDCTRAIEVSAMTLRGRCMNQLPLRGFAKNAAQRWSITHVGNVAEKLAEAKKTLTLLSDYAADYTETVTRLIDHRIDEVESRRILALTLRDRPRRAEVIDKIIDLTHSDAEVGSPFFDTGWGLVNAVSSYYDHHRAGGSASSRFLGALQGETYRTINGVAQYVLAA